MNEFKSFHPIVNLTFFILTAAIAMVFLHPVMLLAGFLPALIYSIMLGSKKTVLYMIPLMIIAAIVNPLYNHRGVTVIVLLPSGNPITLESIVYGLSAAVMVGTVVSIFSCFNRIMTSDKIIYIFGKIIPSTSLVFSMIMRFVPKFSSQLRQVLNAQKCIGKDPAKGSLVSRAKNGVAVLSIMTSWALENSIETADSMKSRGYGLKGRTNYSNYKLDGRSLFALLYMLAAGIYVAVGALMGKLNYEYFPAFSSVDFSPFGISIFLVYFLLCMTPLIIEILENRRWKLLKRKI
ncbi:MAG: energy-coupling factor transporter transmembrane component T [Monoglobales bacterium]